MSGEVSYLVLELVFGESNVDSLVFFYAFERSFVDGPVDDNFLQGVEQKLGLVGSVSFVLFKFLGELAGDRDLL